MFYEHVLMLLGKEWQGNARPGEAREAADLIKNCHHLIMFSSVIRWPRKDRQG